MNRKSVVFNKRNPEIAAGLSAEALSVMPVGITTASVSAACI